MNRANKAVIVVLISSLGLWGCAKGPANGAAAAERIRSLELKLSKLEDDFRAAAAARDSLRQKFAAADEQRAQLEKEVAHLQVAVKERDDFKKQLVVRTSERDVLQTQYDQFRKGLKDLLGQVEAAANSPAQPVTTATAPLIPEKSPGTNLSVN